MKVKELIEELKKYDGELDVGVKYRDLGDLCGRSYDSDLYFGNVIETTRDRLPKGAKIISERKGKKGQDFVSYIDGILLL